MPISDLQFSQLSLSTTSIDNYNKYNSKAYFTISFLSHNINFSTILMSVLPDLKGNEVLAFLSLIFYSVYLTSDHVWTYFALGVMSEKPGAGLTWGDLPATVQINVTGSAALGLQTWEDYNRYINSHPRQEESHPLMRMYGSHFGWGAMGPTHVH